MSFTGLKRAARLLLCRLAWTPSRLGRTLFCKELCWVTGELCLFTGVSAPFAGAMMYFRWLTFRLDFTGLSRASLMLLEAESMKLRRSRVVSLKSSSCSASQRRLPSRLFSMSNSITDPGKQKLMNWGFMIALSNRRVMEKWCLQIQTSFPLDDIINSQIHNNISFITLKTPC
uniref:Uncharacterized protein n=1 Tax=Oryzias melastigma TaxID=30732 RepID=A0A3B3CWG8_ORYME